MRKLFFLPFLFCCFLLPTKIFAAPISPEEAKNIVLQHAKILEKDLNHIKIEQEFDNGILQYEIEFWKDNVEYEYKINVNTGKILEYGQERNRISFTPVSPDQKLLSIDETKKIAVSHAGFDISETRFVKIAQEFKHGYNSYELKFWHDYIEYEYEIDASNGEILEFSVRNYQ